MYSDRINERLQHIVENADRIAEYLTGVSLATFRTDRRTADAVERCLARITEAVIQIGEANVAATGLDVSWQEVKGLGNRLRHEYHRLDSATLYHTAIDDVPALATAAQAALDR